MADLFIVIYNMGYLESRHHTPLPGRAIKPGFSCPAIIQLAEAQLGLFKTFKPMGTFLTSSPHFDGQLFVYKTPFDLWHRNR